MSSRASIPTLTMPCAARQPGGPAISRTLNAELPELGSLDHKEIAELVGLAPFSRQSGQWRASPSGTAENRGGWQRSFEGVYLGQPGGLEFQGLLADAHIRTSLLVNAQASLGTKHLTRKHHQLTLYLPLLSLGMATGSVPRSCATAACDGWVAD